MKVISTKTHGVLDYLEGILLIAVPAIFNFGRWGEAAISLPQILGLGLILYSLVTRYELGVIKSISMKTHLTLDVFAGAFLAISPFLFGFYDSAQNAWLPYVAIGLVIILGGIMTKITPESLKENN